MTASELNDMVSKWPQAARASSCTWNKTDQHFWIDGEFGNSVTTVANLHVASGLAWLMEHSFSVDVIDYAKLDQTESNESLRFGIAVRDAVKPFKCGKMFYGPNLISAINAAVIAVAQETQP